ncbi:DUF302 domain-containing protein [Metabacillus idriensis]|uniref:DUF302 domain-containing protein n=1 Tax=Metabacillus idriensis TaxID=324768 RepID=A0A6I2M312_9BACI|nr:DUF302 domain-containing protein [Metabacillus idriensis]MCM3595516.1 DUF302 domain-containing protein [Metabacillus idriensis]MRX52460.1 DUF302 domain-containing protein [Metabacillus idriensis]OHR65216.1 hypothetical protein HMPREF3291_12975 [Bacillus sp. HMSC76G11]
MFHYTKTLNGSVNDNVNAITELLADEGFGVLWKLDLKDKLNDKGVNFSEEIAILEVCNPFEAKKVLEETILASYFLPCKLIVYSDEGSTKIGMPKPTSLIQLLEDKNLEEIASDIEVRLIKCIDQLS